MVPTMYRVADRVAELADTVTLQLDPVRGGVVTPQPGQFMMLWAFGVGEAPISLAGRVGARLMHTIRGVGAVTRHLCASEPGYQIGVRGPFGRGWGLEPARGNDVVIVAGGLGLAPVRPIVTEILADRSAYGEVSLLVGARSPAELLYRAELEEWQHRDDLGVEVIVDTADRTWSGPVGMVTKLVDRLTGPSPQTRAFVCGPEVMMRFVAVALTDRGVAADRIEVSLERNMHCAIGQCGHCQLGPAFVCTDGPVFPWSAAEPLLRVRER